MKKVNLSISMYILMMGFVILFILSGTAKGEPQWYSGIKDVKLLFFTPVEINFDNPKYVSKVYIEAGCEFERAIDGTIQLYEGYGENQFLVSKIPFSKLLCGDTINVEPVIKATKVKFTLTKSWSKSGEIVYRELPYLTTWKVYADDTPITTPTPTAIRTPTPNALSGIVSLHGEKTDVSVGEDVIFKLSAVNKITKPVMTVQVILIPPSGMSVTSSEFATSGAGQYTSTYNLDPGTGKDIEIRVMTNQQGDFNVRGEIILYYGNDKSTAEEQTLNLPIKVRETPNASATTPTPQSQPLSIWIILLIFTLLIFGSFYIFNNRN